MVLAGWDGSGVGANAVVTVVDLSHMLPWIHYVNDQMGPTIAYPLQNTLMECTGKLKKENEICSRRPTRQRWGVFTEGVDDGTGAIILRCGCV